MSHNHNSHSFVYLTTSLLGHCVGGGAMLALSHDYRVMRGDRGWIFVPIVKLGHTLPVGLLELAKLVWL